VADASDFATFFKNGSWHLKTQLSYAFAKLLGGDLRAIALTTARLAIEHRLAASLHGMGDDKRKRAIRAAILGAIVGALAVAIGNAIFGAFAGAISSGWFGDPSDPFNVAIVGAILGAIVGAIVGAIFGASKNK